VTACILCGHYRAKNCSSLWDKFHTSFAYKDPCLAPAADSYREFLDAAMFDIDTNNSVSATVLSLSVRLSVCLSL